MFSKLPRNGAELTETRVEALGGDIAETPSPFLQTCAVGIYILDATRADPCAYGQIHGVMLDAENLREYRAQAFLASLRLNLVSANNN